MRELVKSTLEEHRLVVAKMTALEGEIASAGELCGTALARGQRIYLCGNGGSAADAQHIAAELIGRFVHERRALPAIALTTDTSALTAIGNDYGYDAVFSRQVEGLCREGDVLIAISTSGSSSSVLAACEQAQALGCEVVGLTGRDGGALKTCCETAVIAPADDTAHIQECHIVMVHLLCALIEQGLELA